MIRLVRPHLVCALLVLSTPTFALERQARAFGDADLTWTSGTTCVIQYFNICTGWIWCWDFGTLGARAGTVFDSCGQDSPHQLLSTSSYNCSYVPCGRGFTGSIAVYAADANGCAAGERLAWQPYCPSSGWTQTTWNIDVPPRFVLIMEAQDTWPYGFLRPASDHPSAGATGPQACGSCYPENRPTHSFDFGTAAAPICPGEPLDDGICNAELLTTASFSQTVGTTESSWGDIKGLYK